MTTREIGYQANRAAIRSFTEQGEVFKKISSLVVEKVPEVKTIVYLPKLHDSVFSAFAVIVGKEWKKGMPALALAVESACRKFLPVIVFGGKVNKVVEEANYWMGLPERLIYQGIVIYDVLNVELPPFRSKKTADELAFIYNKWTEEGAYGKYCCDAAIKAQVEGNFNACCSLLRPAIDGSLRAVVGMYIGYMPKGCGLPRLLKIIVLIDPRSYAVFSKNTPSSKAAVKLLLGRILVSKWDTYHEALLNLLAIKIQLLTVWAEEAFNYEITANNGK